MREKILVPLDGSKRAESIISHVEKIAGCMGAEVFLMQVVEPSFVTADFHGLPPSANPDILEHQNQIAENYLNTIQESLSKQGIKTQTIVEFGPIVNSIIDAAERVEASMIAMASHGRTGLARAFYGSVAAGVLQQASCALLLIRSQNG